MNPVIKEIYRAALVRKQPLFYHILRQDGKSTYTIKTKRDYATYKNTIGTFVVDEYCAITINDLCRMVEEKWHLKS